MGFESFRCLRMKYAGLMGGEGAWKRYTLFSPVARPADDFSCSRLSSPRRHAQIESITARFNSRPRMRAPARAYSLSRVCTLYGTKKLHANSSSIFHCIEQDSVFSSSPNILCSDVCVRRLGTWNQSDGVTVQCPTPLCSSILLARLTRVRISHRPTILNIEHLR